MANSTENKKVLLRERKRHTARRVVSTPSVLAGGVRVPPLGVRVPPRGVRVPPRGGSRYPPLWTDRLMDGQTRVKTLPSLVLRTRAVMKCIHINYCTVTFSPISVISPPGNISKSGFRAQASSTLSYFLWSTGFSK